jgi:hypothetical protein
MDNLILLRLANEIGTLMVNKIILEQQLEESNNKLASLESVNKVTTVVDNGANPA